MVSWLTSRSRPGMLLMVATMVAVLVVIVIEGVVSGCGDGELW